MAVTTEVAETIDAPPEVVFDLGTPAEMLPRLFRGYGPIPGIAKAEIVGGGELKAGAIRRITNTDGSVIDEEIIELRRPEKHVYRLIRGFKFPFSLLVRGADSDWTFSAAGAGTRVAWRFSFVPTTPLVSPVVGLIARRFFRRAQAECLTNLKQHAERTVVAGVATDPA